tara:strand:- start:324 stop:809 length:486 start_codon:yes stop_codon:yes gene_type:complete
MTTATRKLTIMDLPEDIVKYEIMSYLVPIKHHLPPLKYPVNDTWNKELDHAPEHLTSEEMLYILYINELNTKELTKFCKENKIKQSRNGVTNQYCKRMNILEHLFKRKLHLADRLVTTFTKQKPRRDVYGVYPFMRKQTEHDGNAYGLSLYFPKQSCPERY